MDLWRHSDGRNGDVTSKRNRRKGKDNKAPMTANLSGTRYEIVKQVVLDQGFELARDDDFKNCYLIWSDAFISSERISDLKPFQRVNHFPGMGEICRKDSLARNMNLMSKHKPHEYDFVPRTWVLPQDYASYLSSVREAKKQERDVTYIMKPWNGAMGNGIRLYRNGEVVTSSESCIMQEYIDKPFLIDGYKCDMRIYVLVTSCDPLRVFLYKEGLLRLSTEPYMAPTDKNTDALFVHLTNYSVNKHNEKYDRSGDETTGSKRSLSFFNEYLKRNNHDVATLWKNITHILLKTIILASPHVFHAYKVCRPGQTAANDSVCFEILGFDVILDHKLRPWLLEVNRSPSFGTDEELDLRVKRGLLSDTFRLLNIRPSDKKRNLIALRTESQRRLFGASRPGAAVMETSRDSENIKRHRDIVKKKEELRDALIRLRYDARRDEFEAQNCGHFTRILPVEDTFRQQQYANLIVELFTIFNKNRCTGLQKEIQYVYLNKLREDDIIEMMAECESQERKLSQSIQPRNGRSSSIPPVTTVPSSYLDLGDSTPEISTNSSSDTENNSSDDASISLDISIKPHPPHHHKVRQQSSALSGRNSRQPIQTMSQSSSKTSSMANSPAHNATNFSKMLGTNNNDNESQVPPLLVSSSVSRSQQLSMPPLGEAAGEDVQHARNVLKHLTALHIKFPGKSNEEATEILCKIRSEWSQFKADVASYWLVKLDAEKRRRIVDIVRTNVRAVLIREFSRQDMNRVRLHQIFMRLWNRMLSSQGQGLWDTFTNRKSWESQFQNFEELEEVEVRCCARVVILCQDCLLVVYKYASESHQGHHQHPPGHGKALQINNCNQQSILDDSNRPTPSPLLSPVLLTAVQTSSTRPPSSTSSVRTFYPRGNPRSQSIMRKPLNAGPQPPAMLRRNTSTTSLASVVSRRQSDASTVSMSVGKPNRPNLNHAHSTQSIPSVLADMRRRGKPPLATSRNLTKGLA